MVRVVVVAVAVLVASWALLVLLARRLPPGILKDLAAFLPACVTVARRLRRDPRVPLRAKVVVGFAALWVLSPIDLIPEFLPVIGPLDDVVVVALALRYAARQVPRDVLFDAWPAEPRLLEACLEQDVRSRRPRPGKGGHERPRRFAVSGGETPGRSHLLGPRTLGPEGRRPL